MSLHNCMTADLPGPVWKVNGHSMSKPIGMRSSVLTCSFTHFLREYKANGVRIVSGARADTVAYWPSADNLQQIIRSKGNIDKAGVVFHVALVVDKLWLWLRFRWCGRPLALHSWLIALRCIIRDARSCTISSARCNIGVAVVFRQHWRGV